MTCCLNATDKIEPEEQLNNFKLEAFEHTGEHLEHKRKATDVLILTIYGIVTVLFTCLMIYCIRYGEIRRITNGYDSCGNVCGILDNFVPASPPDGAYHKKGCQGLSMLGRDYLLVYKPNKQHPTTLNYSDYGNAYDAAVPKTLSDKVERVCLHDCSPFPGYRPFLHRCVLKRSKHVVDTFFGKSGLTDFFEEASEDLELCWKEIVYLCLVSLVFSLLITILLRFLVSVVVWLVLLGVMFACIAGTIYLWILWHQSRAHIDSLAATMIAEIDSRRAGSYLAFAILATLVTIGVILIVLIMRKRIELVIRLFREAGKALAAMPLLLFEPLLTFLCLVLIAATWLYCALWIESAGFATEIHENFFVYEKNIPILVARWWNILLALWTCQFVIGCQHMVIAGAVAIWYFARDKTRLGTPIFYSFHNLARFHLGSVALGSLLIAIVQLVRLVISLVERYLKSHEGRCVAWGMRGCQCCLFCLEKILKYLSRNAYIEVAIYGHSFCRAGRQAFKLLTANAVRVAAINSIGDFVLFLGKVLVVMATVVVGIELIQKKEGVLHSWVPLTLAAIFAYLISHCFMTVYEMAIDTIFLCFCEDCERNDGVSQPYFMSKDLMEFVENSKKAMDSHRETQPNEQSPPTVSAIVDGV